MKKYLSLCLTVIMALLMLTGCKTSNDDTVVRVGSLKGPTSIGLVYLRKLSDDGASEGNYEFVMEVAPDTLVASMAQGNLDIALIPANVASALYNKTEGGVCVIDINTLGVLYLVGSGSDVSSLQDLGGKTILLTGKGTTPDFVLQYMLSSAGVQNVNLEYKSEATEVVAALAENNASYGLIPQPFVTAACMQNDNLKVVLDMNELWNKNCEGAMVTGVTVVRKEFLEQHPEAVDLFIEEHANSTSLIDNDLELVAQYTEEYGIIEKAAVATKAIPFCNIICMDGAEMKDALSSYLDILAGFDASFIGGSVPGDDFYYIAE